MTIELVSDKTSLLRFNFFSMSNDKFFTSDSTLVFLLFLDNLCDFISDFSRSSPLRFKNSLLGEFTNKFVFFISIFSRFFFLNFILFFFISTSASALV